MTYFAKFTEEIIEQIALMLLPLGFVDLPRSFLLALSDGDRPMNRKLVLHQQQWNTGTSIYSQRTFR